MEYYLNLAVMQNARFKEFEQAHPENNRLENRIAFFSQRYEIHISHSITTGIAQIKEYEDIQARMKNLEKS